MNGSVFRLSLESDQIRIPGRASPCGRASARGGSIPPQIEPVHERYVGRFVELAPKRELFDRPLHPYTRSLLAAVPVADPDRPIHRIVLGGDAPDPIDPPEGCRFHPRCPEVMPECSQETPTLEEVEPGRWVACLRVKPAEPPEDEEPESEEEPEGESEAPAS